MNFRIDSPASSANSQKCEVIFDVASLSVELERLQQAQATPDFWNDRERARETLPAVSRTFAPAIGLLPRGLAHTVRLAYLLCRVADTIEDAPGLTGEARGESLLRFRALLEGGSEGEPERFAAEIGRTFPAADAEADLIRSLPRLLAMLDAIPAEPRRTIATWTGELALGMALFTGLDRGSGWTSWVSTMT